jgi:inorganic pyrophosphatase
MPSSDSNHQSRHALRVPARVGALIHVIVDSPGGSANKYKFDEELGLFKLSRVLPSGLHFPCDFGFVPSTRAEDGDALDVALLGASSSFVGCLVTARMLGVISASQVEKGRAVRNDRIVAIAITPVNKPRERLLRDLPPQQVRDIENFFVNYNQAQGRIFRPEGRLGPSHAAVVLKQAMNKHSAEGWA